jgi:hypothetical protein
VSGEDHAEHVLFAWRVELGRLAALMGAAGLAIAQPVLDAFGKSPETFIFRDVAGTDLVVFALAVVLVPPLVLWSAGLLVGWRAPRWRVFVHGASIGVLVGLAVAQLLAGAAHPVAVAAALLLGLAAWVLTVRAKAFQMWGQLLVCLPVMALVVFLAASPASDLLAEDGFQAAAASGEASPVVLVVLDELPTASIIDAHGAIDAVRFPNLARLAGDGTWYRNHTTMAGFTTHAVPTILTGQVPELDEHAAPLYTEHPDNLFRLLAGSHALVVSEALTRLCPISVCGDDPRPPAGSAGAASDDGGPGAQLGALFHDALDLWVERVSGGSADPTDDLGEFEEAVEAVSASDPTLGSGEAVSGLGEWQNEGAEVPSRLSDFIEAMHPGDKPMAAVIHLVSPHFPWSHLPDGRTYAEPAEGSDLPINGGNGGVPWVASLERQRHLLQASYTDRLVGQILQQLEAVDMYDEAAVVVTADHGIAFQADENRRLPIPAALPEIMWTPLIVKAPGQTEPRVDDSNMQTIDVVPTIADLIGVDIPWHVDGLAAGSDAQLARGDQKVFRRIRDTADPNPSAEVEVDGAAGFADMLTMSYPAIGPDDDPLAALHALSGHPELIGQPYEPDGEVASDTFAVDDLDRLLSEEELVVVLTGTVTGGEVDEDAVVAVVDDRVAAVGPVVFRNLGGAAFALLLPLDRIADLGEVRLALLRDGEVLDAGPLAG